MSLPKPYYDHGGITIYHADCRDILPDLPKVNLVLTDPPYSLPNNQFRPEARMLQRTFGDFTPYICFWELFIKYIIKLGVDDLIVFCDETFYPVIYPQLYMNFYATKLIVWNKNRIGMGGIWRRQFELITHSYRKPKAEKSGDSDIVTVKPVRNKLHTSQKPVELIITILEKIKSDLTLDPFLGSGTTLIAAQQLGRKAIGIEIEEKYCEIAVKRLGQEVLDFG